MSTNKVWGVVLYVLIVEKLFKKIVLFTNLLVGKFSRQSASNKQYIGSYELN